MPYVEAQKLLDEDYPEGGRYYWKSVNVGAFGDEAIEALVARAEAAPSHHSTIDVWYQGGAMGRVAAGETAFGERGSPSWSASRPTGRSRVKTRRTSPGRG